MSIKQIDPWIFTSLASVAYTFYIHKHPLRGDSAVLIEAALASAATVFSYTITKSGFLASLSTALKLLSLHGAVVIAATTLYRLSPFHPLWRFPGPLINKITSLRLAQIVFSGKRHLVIADLHARYGKVVRTAPNTISINSHAAVHQIYASSNAMDKSHAYRLKSGMGDGLFFMQNREPHNERRRLWAGGFTPQAMARWKAPLEKRTFQLMECVASRSDAQGVVNLFELYQHWSYDVMGDVAFGGANQLELMAEGDPEGLVNGGQMATVFFETLGEVPSLFDILWYLPVTNDIKRLENVAEHMMLTRQKAGGGQEVDLASYLLQEDVIKTKMTAADLRLDGLFAIQAGSDTTTGVLNYMTYLLLSNEDAYAKCREELDQTFPDPNEVFPDGVLEALPYLNGVVTEGLRLGTPFPGLPRMIPKGGAIIDEIFIPEETIIGVPAYAQETSEDNFYPDPFAFKPERWLPGGLGPDSRARKSAVMAFSSGPFGCLGKALAVQELRVVLARLVLTYDVKLAPTFDHQKFMDGIQNMRTTLFKYPLMVVATPRH